MDLRTLCRPQWHSMLHSSRRRSRYRQCSTGAATGGSFRAPTLGNRRSQGWRRKCCLTLGVFLGRHLSRRGSEGWSRVELGHCPTEVKECLTLTLRDGLSFRLVSGSDRTWSVGELAAAAGTTRRALHHYDEIGLLVPTYRAQNGTRRYTEVDMERLRSVHTLRGLGLSLTDVGRVLDGEESASLERLLGDQLERSKAQLEEEQVRRERLLGALEALKGSPGASPEAVIDELGPATLMRTWAQETIAILAYADVQATHDFLVDAFALRPGGVYTDDDERAVHGEVYAANGSRIWLHGAATEHGLSSPRDLQSATGGVLVLVKDVDGHHRHARSVGAQIDYAPTDQPYGLREYGARDPEGGRWYFAQAL